MADATKAQNPPVRKHHTWKHGHYVRGAPRSRTFHCWIGIKDRCLNPKNKRYGRYGGRGVTICEEWKNNFLVFLKDMGEMPNGLTIDRIDNDGNYEPNNCRWATTQDQNRNRSITKMTLNNAHELRQRAACGEKLVGLARRFKIATKTVDNIRASRKWKDDYSGVPNW